MWWLYRYTVLSAVWRKSNQNQSFTMMFCHAKIDDWSLCFNAWCTAETHLEPSFSFPKKDPGVPMCKFRTLVGGFRYEDASVKERESCICRRAGVSVFCRGRSYMCMFSLCAFCHQYVHRSWAGQDVLLCLVFNNRQWWSGFSWCTRSGSTSILSAMWTDLC